MRAQSIAIDGRLAAARTLAGPNYAIRADLGRQVGGNPSHSFGRFNVGAAKSAAFIGPASVGDVIGRVTGGSPTPSAGSSPA